MNLIKTTKRLVLTSASVSLLGFSAHADTTWIGADHAAINTAANWDPSTLPDDSGTNNGLIKNGLTADMTGRHDLDSKNYIVSNGSTIYSGSTNAFRWDGGTVTLSGGHLDVDYTSTSVIGRDSGGGLTTLIINAGSSANFAAGLEVGRTSQGVVNQFGGTMFVGSTLRMQTNASGVASDNVYNLSGGTVSAGNFIVGDYNNDDSNYFNFTTGSTGTFTITQAAFDFATFIAAGEIRLNDNASSSLGDFLITSAGGETTLSLIPEPGTYALLAGLCALTSIMVRRRR